MLHNGEAQPGSARLPRTVLVHAIEALEQARQVLGGDAGAEVAHQEFDGAVARLRSHHHAAAFGPVAQRVLDQVGEHLLQRVAVAPNLASSGQLR